jgi:hypothetical protein
MLHEYAFKIGKPALNYVRTDNIDAQPILCLHGLARGWQSFLPLFRRWLYVGRSMRSTSAGTANRSARMAILPSIMCRMLWASCAMKSGVQLFSKGIHSLGAMVAAAVAAEAIDLVRAVILEDPPFETMGARVRSYPLYPYFTLLRSNRWRVKRSIFHSWSKSSEQLRSTHFRERPRCAICAMHLRCVFWQNACNDSIQRP